MKKMKTLKKIVEKMVGMRALKKYGNLWEDFYDTLNATSRSDEPRETLEEVKQMLIENRKLIERTY
jgi:hypothetical protein